MKNQSQSTKELFSFVLAKVGDSGECDMGAPVHQRLAGAEGAGMGVLMAQQKAKHAEISVRLSRVEDVVERAHLRRVQQRLPEHHPMGTVRGGSERVQRVMILHAASCVAEREAGWK